jgi:hypothetical protein
MVGALAGRLDARQIQIIDHWEGDLFAVGIARADDPARLVYVSTYRMPPEHYAFECEEPRRGEEYRVLETADLATFSQLVEAIRRHLSVASAP